MATRPVHCDESFAHAWQVEALNWPPQVIPSSQYAYPKMIAEVELGALQILVRPSPISPQYLATFALGFADQSMPYGVWSCPDPEKICAVAGGYAFLVDAGHPEIWEQVPYRPVTEVRPVPEFNLLLFAGFYAIWALGPSGKAWETKRLSWEGLRMTHTEGTSLIGMGWDLLTDTEVEFKVDLATGKHSGGAGPV